MTLLSCVDSHLGEEFRLHFKSKRFHHVQLLCSVRIEGAVERTRDGILRQRFVGRQPIGGGGCVIVRVRARKQLSEVGFEDCLVGHDGTSCFVRARYLSSRVPVWGAEWNGGGLFQYPIVFSR